MKRIWSELLPIETLENGGTRAMLRARGLGLIAAITPDVARDAARLVRLYRDDGCAIALWPMLDDAHGRWPNVRNARRFEHYVLGLLEGLEREDALPDEIALDLEPPIGAVRRVLAGELAAFSHLLSMRDGRAASDRYARLVRDLEARGVRCFAAAVPFVLASRPHASLALQDVFGTPVDAAGVSRVSAMLYTSLFEGYSMGRLDRADALSLLGAYAKLAAQRYGERASVSVGVIGGGIVGNERSYRSPRELEEDVGVALDAGIADVCAFDLGGAFERGKPEAWLDAIVQAEPRPCPLLTRRASLVLTAIDAAAGPIALARRAREIALARSR